MHAKKGRKVDALISVRAILYPLARTDSMISTNTVLHEPTSRTYMHERFPATNVILQVSDISAPVSSHQRRHRERLTC